MPPEVITVSNNWVRALLQHAEGEGVATARVLGELGIDPSLLRSSGGARLGIDDTVRIWQRCAEASGDPCFGLNFGAGVRPGTFHIVGYTLMNSTSLREAFAKLQRYQRLISDGGALQQVPMRHGIWLIYHTRPETLPFNYHQIDAVLAAVVSFSRTVTGRPFDPLEVRFQRPAPADVAPYEALFHCPVRFDAEFDGILADEAMLGTPLLDADEELCRIHEEHAQRRLQQLSSESSWRERVAEIVSRRLADRELSRRQVAAELGLSERSLQRKLAAEGLTFQGLHDEVRRQHALGYVADTAVPLAEVSELLGFSDLSAFYRAFRRWTGKTPGEYRA